MADVLKVAFATITQASGDASGQDLVLTGTNPACTVLSVSLCNTHASNDETFSMSARASVAAKTRISLEPKARPSNTRVALCRSFPSACLLSFLPVLPEKSQSCSTKPSRYLRNLRS